MNPIGPANAVVMLARIAENTITINRNDSVPKISWGKYFTEGDKVLLPFSVQVHHALADGYHVGKYVNDLQKYLDSVR